MLIKSVTNIDLSVAANVNTEIPVAGGTVTITQLTPGAVVRISINERDAQSPSFSVPGRVSSGGERIEKVYLNAAQQLGTIEITVHDPCLELQPFSSATRKPGAVLVAHVQSGAQATGNLHTPAGLQINDGTIVSITGGGVATNDHDDTTGLEGFHIKANLNAGASLNKQVFLTHLSGAHIRNMFSAVGPQRGSINGRIGTIRLRDRVCQVLATKANSGARRAFFGFGGVGTNHAYGMGFYADRNLGNAHWYASFANNDAADSTVFTFQDLGLAATDPHTLELVTYGNGVTPVAEWWIDGVLKASFSGAVGTPMNFGDLKLCVSYFAQVGSSLAADGTESSLWVMMGDGLVLETEAA